mmetsp:Transcript_51419/g.134280  ORF Transcript_51419/g.134280 Transcript_51419/m.134280 type:complete len:80 (-) Transcript_51419:669-908(-)
MTSTLFILDVKEPTAPGCRHSDRLARAGAPLAVLCIDLQEIVTLFGNRAPILTATSQGNMETVVDSCSAERIVAQTTNL